MTNEEAIKILSGAIKRPNTEDGYLGQALSIAIAALSEQKKGRVLYDERYNICVCSECGYTAHTCDYYCSNCGVEFESEEQDE